VRGVNGWAQKRAGRQVFSQAGGVRNRSGDQSVGR